MTEEEVYERFANQELIGSSNQRFAQQIQMFLASNWGKRGLVIGMSLISFVIINEVYSMTFTLVRYRRKLKLYKKGIVTDLNDYHKPFGIIGHLKYLIKNRNKQDSSFYYKKNIRKKVEEINYDRYK
ncbi:hypothetical protein KDU71_01460 [Carboxylicivirga sediminis]|uniref:Uncharacterized protein n=1 Tax=Carboxylicivirga sediminis TaxID=2006564 RepID=A0A941EYU3_9BACT|nr:hypothetical protein [Carboxylicivirga sediminis]MBR8534213.1 hypothetical protein [Carboxylicivirga sediminis]